jgi:hypothetical protein
MADVTIEIIKNGPFIVKGPLELKDSEGNAYPPQQRMALCRCGHRLKSHFATAPIPRSVSERPSTPFRNRRSSRSAPKFGVTLYDIYCLML